MGKSNKMSRLGLKKNIPKRLSKAVKKIKRQAVCRETQSLQELKLKVNTSIEEKMNNLDLEKKKGSEKIKMERDNKIQEYLSTYGVKNKTTLEKSIAKSKTMRLSKAKRKRLEKKQKMLKKMTEPVKQEEILIPMQEETKKPKKEKNKKMTDQPKPKYTAQDDIAMFQSINSMQNFQSHPLATIKEHITSSLLIKDKEEKNKMFLSNLRENIMNALPNI